MKNKLFALGLLVFLSFGAVSCKQLQARDNLNKGVRAFRNQKYEDAVKYFQTAGELDPKLTVAQLYLATAYTQQYVPGLQTEENQKFADSAIRTFEMILEREPENPSAIAGLASLYQFAQQYRKSKEFYLKQAELEPNNKVPYYAVGSVDWIICYNKAGDPITDEEKAVLVDEGLANLEKALAIDPEYEDAMTYMNLLYRQKAELAKNKADLTKDKAEKVKLNAEKDDLIAQADKWFAKVLETRKINQEKKKGPAGIILDEKK